MTRLDDAAQLRIDQAAAARTRPRAQRRPFTPHVCQDCAHPTRLDRAAFRAAFEQAQREACDYCLPAYPCEVHR